MILPEAGRCQALWGVTQVASINAPPRRAARYEPGSLDRGSDLNPDKTAIADKRDSCERREPLTESLGRFGRLGCAVYDLEFASPRTKADRPKTTGTVLGPRWSVPETFATQGPAVVHRLFTLGRGRVVRTCVRCVPECV